MVFPALVREGGYAIQAKKRSCLHVALGGLPDKMHVEADPGLGVSAKTVGDLRKMMAWPENLVITVPQEHHLAGAIKISKASVIGRISPKP
jgi:hypothetical protein